MFTLPGLNYSYDALAKSISGEIMELHHTKHHQGYVDKLNKSLENYPELQSKSIEDLLRNLSELPSDIQTAVRNNGGGHYNHSLFWLWMSPDGGGEPTSELAEAIIARYGSIDAFKAEFEAKALGLFGSGWVWLQPNMDIVTTANQDSLLSSGEPEPILGLDVWEHAYYLDYKNRRDEYIKTWWDVVDWTVSEQAFSTK